MRAWPWTVFRICCTVSAVLIFNQAVFAGQFLGGSFGALRTHRENATAAGVAVLVTAVVAVLVRLFGGGPVWPALAALGLFGLIAGQIMLLPSRLPLPRPFQRPLPIPEVLEPSRGGEFRIVQRAGTAEILPGVATPIWGYQGRFPGPTLRTRSGRPVVVRHRNELPVPTVWRGLAGSHLVSDDEEDRLPLPRGDRDLPLMIADRSFAADGSLAYPGRSGRDTPGLRAGYAAGVLGGMTGWTINGAPFDPDVSIATPRLGRPEIWRNMSDFHHPVHLHLAPFRVLSRGIGGPGRYDHGWKDTIDLRPAEEARLLVRFDDYAGRYVLHCHNLEHEDMAMMAMFTTVQI